jgi:hypothetical protein
MTLMSDIKGSSQDTQIEFIEYFNRYYEVLFKELTIWDMVFIARHYDSDIENWCDVEKEISDSFTNSSLLNSVKNSNSSLNSFTINDRLNSRSSPERIISTLLMSYYSKNHISSPVDRVIVSDAYRVTNDDWYRFLYNQLKKFEETFKVYIDEIVSIKDVNFLNKSFYEFKIISEYQLDRTINIMNFNYTTFIPKGLYKKSENVHGKALQNDEVIFGIDSSEIKNTDPHYIFTKTYRKVARLATNNFQRTKNSVLQDGIKTIIFYGHSLNNQDHSYFQTIFDLYNIYDNKITLKFKYSIYNEAKSQIIEEDQVRKVIDLLSKYGETIDNKYKGKNLIHKLLNEKRLIIEKV